MCSPFSVSSFSRFLPLSIENNFVVLTDLSKLEDYLCFLHTAILTEWSSSSANHQKSKEQNDSPARLSIGLFLQCKLSSYI